VGNAGPTGIATPAAVAAAIAERRIPVIGPETRRADRGAAERPIDDR
jgi:hypothetical protein